MIDKYLKDQHAIQTVLNHPMGTNTDTVVKENILAIIVEATEALNHVNWKPWKKQLSLLDRRAIVEEMVDIARFYFNILNQLEVTPDEFDIVWDRVTGKIMERHNNGY
jgi:dimeric dUTPase (all-alpha-NTP-PPase superfamily)